MCSRGTNWVNVPVEGRDGFMEHYKRLKNLFDVMEEGHLLLEPLSIEDGGKRFIIRECNDAFLSMFNLHKEIVLNKSFDSIGVVQHENYLKLASLLEDVYETESPGKRDIFFCQSLVDATVTAITSEGYIDVLIYNWSKRDAFDTAQNLENLTKIFVSRQLCYIEMNEQFEIVRFIGDIEKTLHLNRCDLQLSEAFFKDLIYYKDYDLFVQNIKQTNDKIYTDIHFRIIGQHGEKVWVRLDYIKVDTHIAAIIENIDVSKRVEADFQKNKETLREVQKLTQTGNWEWDILGDQYHISEGLMTLLDVAPKEVEGLKDFYRERLTSDPSEGRQSLMSHEAIYEFLKPDGNRIWLSDKHRKKYDDYGNLVSIFGITQEITEEKRLYDQIVQLNEEYESIYHSVKAAIMVVEVLENGHFMYSNMNAEALGLFDVTEEEVIGESPENVMDELGQRLLYHYTTCAQNKESIRVMERLHRYGRECKLICLLSPKIEEGRVTKIVISALESF